MTLIFKGSLWLGVPRSSEPQLTLEQQSKKSGQKSHDEKDIAGNYFTLI